MRHGSADHLTTRAHEPEIDRETLAILGSRASSLGAALRVAARRAAEAHAAPGTTPTDEPSIHLTHLPNLQSMLESSR